MYQPYIEYLNISMSYNLQPTKFQHSGHLFVKAHVCDISVYSALSLFTLKLCSALNDLCPSCESNGYALEALF